MEPEKTSNIKTQKKIFRILSRLARKRGIKVWLEDRMPDALNGLWMISKGKESIHLNTRKLLDLNKLNFVFAHELGHSTLHKGRIDNIRYLTSNANNDYKKAIEAEADLFAEALINRLTELFK